VAPSHLTVASIRENNRILSNIALKPTSGLSMRPLSSE
jgi:hypothetical protein